MLRTETEVAAGPSILGGTFTDIVLDVGRGSKDAQGIDDTVIRKQKVLGRDEYHYGQTTRAQGRTFDVFIHGTTLATNASNYRAPGCKRRS